MQSLDASTGLPRFNMLFELGLFVGCRHFSSDPQQTSKDFLVLDSEPNRFRASVSDFAGYDIAPHNNSPQETVKVVRNWLATALSQTLYGSLKVQEEFRRFEAVLPIMAAEFAPHPDQIPYTDLCDLIRRWVLKAPAATELKT